MNYNNNNKYYTHVGLLLCWMWNVAHVIIIYWNEEEDQKILNSLAQVIIIIKILLVLHIIITYLVLLIREFLATIDDTHYHQVNTLLPSSSITL